MPRYSQYGATDTVVGDEGDVSFLRLNTRLRPDQLQPGDVAGSVNGRMDVDGAWQVRKGVDSFGPTLTANTEALILSATPVIKLYGSTPKAISSATRSTTTVTITTSASHGFSSNTLVNIYGLSGTVDPNGNRLITVTGSATFTYTITGATGSETYGGTGNARNPILSETATTGVYGSCIFSDPSTTNTRYILRATNKEVLAVNVSTGVSTSIAYPSGVTIGVRVEMLQCFDKVLLFRPSGVAALEWNGSLSGNPAFTVVANGTYTQPVYFDAAGNTTITDGVVTVTATSHGLSVGDKVYVIDRGSSELEEGDKDYTVSEVPGVSSFKFYAQVRDMAANLVVISKKVSSGRGFVHMPSPEFGVYHQRRLWVPYTHNSGNPGTSRNRTDEIIASDILDYNTFDQLQNQYRITAGVADYVICIEPFAEDNLLVFNRNSIHLIRGVGGALTDTTTQLITTEVGCVARRSILQVGNQVMFLSDNGVYAAQFGDLYNLRGAGVPLSEPINSLIQRINRNYVGNSVAAYFNNRYYLAIPLDASTVNNAILIYNFLNQGWESLDTTGQNGWEIQNFLVVDSGGLSKLYTVSSSGSIHIVDERSAGSDRLSLFAGVPATVYSIAPSVTTRQYAFGQLGRKKFSTYELHVESSESESSEGTISIDIENPDFSEALSTISALNGETLGVGEDTSLRGRIGNKRGYAAQIVLTPSNGRPKLRAVKLQASLTDPTITSKS